MRLCTCRTAHRESRGIALLRLCTGRKAHRKSRGIALLRLCTGRTAHRGSRGIALLRLCTGRTAHRESRGIALLRLCTGRTAHRESRGIALLFHDQRHQKGGEGSASRPGRSLPPGKRRQLLYRRLGGPQDRYGQVRKITPPTGIRSPDRPARSQYSYMYVQRKHKATVCSPKFSLKFSVSKNAKFSNAIEIRILSTKLIFALHSYFGITLTL